MVVLNGVGDNASEEDSSLRGVKIFFAVMLLVELAFALYLISRQYVHINSVLGVPAIVKKFDDGLYMDGDLEFSKDYTGDKLVQQAWQKFYIISMWILVVCLDCIPFTWELTDKLSFLWPQFVNPVIGRNMSFAIIAYAASELLLLPMHSCRIIKKAKYGKWTATEIITRYLLDMVTNLVPGVLAIGLGMWAVMHLERSSIGIQIMILGFLAILAILLYPFLDMWYLIREKESDLETRRAQGLPMSRSAKILEIRLRILCNRVGFPRKHILVYPSGSTETFAFYYGFLGYRRILIFQGHDDNWNEEGEQNDEGDEYEGSLILTPKEIEAIAAHELGHWYYSHADHTLLIWHAAKISTAILVYWLRSNHTILQMFHLSPPSSTDDHLGKGATYIPGAFIVYFIILRVYIVLFDTIFQVHCHLTELQADAYAAVKLGYYKTFTKTLIKLVIAQQTSFPSADPLYQLIYHNHPSLVHRLRLVQQQFKSLKQS